MGAGDGLLLIDRHEKEIVRAKGSADPIRTANWSGWSIFQVAQAVGKPITLTMISMYLSKDLT